MPEVEEKDYATQAYDEAKDTVREFMDEIIEQLLDNGEASDDLRNDYAEGGSYHHETHVDRWYSTEEAVKLLDALDEYEETDSGLWQGEGWRNMLSTIAAFTYGHAVYAGWENLIERINDEIDLDDERRFIEDAVVAERIVPLEELGINRKDWLEEDPQAAQVRERLEERLKGLIQEEILR